MQDYFNREIKVDDYIVYSVIEANKRIEMYIAKIVKINDATLTVTMKDWCNEFVTTVLRRPDRAIIISEELALIKEPRFKDLKE